MYLSRYRLYIWAQLHEHLKTKMEENDVNNQIRHFQVGNTTTKYLELYHIVHQTHDEPDLIAHSQRSGHLSY
jgi:hypothetical protein